LCLWLSGGGGGLGLGGGFSSSLGINLGGSLGSLGINLLGLCGGSRLSSLVFSSKIGSVFNTNGMSSLLFQGFEKFNIFSFAGSGSLPGFDLGSLEDSLSSKSDIGDESLDSGGLIVDLSSLFDFSGVEDNISSGIVLLCEVEKFSDSGGSLGTSSSWLLFIGESFNGCITLLNDAKSQSRDIGSNDTSSNGFLFSLTSSSGSIGGVSFRHEDTGSASNENTLLHGKSVLVVSSCDLQDVILPAVTKGISRDFSTESLAHEDRELVFVINNEGKILTGCRISDV